MKALRAWGALGLVVALARSASAAPPVATDPTGVTTPSPLLEVASDSSCPAGASVNGLLGEIFGLTGGERLNESATLAHEAAGLVVSLRSADGRLLGERSLPLEGDCAALARAAGVVLATWLSDAHPEFVPHFRNAPGSAAGTAGAAGAAGAAASGAEPLPPGDAPSSAASAPPAARTYARLTRVTTRGHVVPRGTLRTRVGLALGASLVAPVAFTGAASVSLVPEGSGIGATLRAGASSPRSVDVDTGRVRYFRWPLAAGATLRWAGSALAVELDAGAALAWLHVSGRSFTPNRAADDATFGPVAHVRLLARGGVVRPFVEVAQGFWLRSARVYSDAGRPSVALPNYELGLLVGAALVP